jgi:hypothetical protein
LNSLLNLPADAVMAINGSQFDQLKIMDRWGWKYLSQVFVSSSFGLDPDLIWFLYEEGGICNPS